MSAIMDRFRVKGRAINDIMRDVNAIMEERGIQAEESDFSSFSDLGPLDQRIWPSVETAKQTGNWLRWIACFPVQGNSEGIYVHIELIFQSSAKGTSERRLIGTAKCYTWENALAMANCAAEIFEGNDAYKRRDDVW
jgi:hypothetical protein